MSVCCADPWRMVLGCRRMSRALRTYGDGTVIVTIPSHAPEYRGVREELLGRVAASLDAARIVIIDVRGNEGGSAAPRHPSTPFALHPDGKSSSPRRTTSTSGRSRPRDGCLRS